MAQHSRQKSSSAFCPRVVRMMLLTAAEVSGDSSCARVRSRATRACRRMASRGSSSGRQATAMSMPSSAAREAKAVSQARDSGSAQWTSSRVRTTGPLRTERLVTTQSSPSRTPCGSGLAPGLGADSPVAGATMSYQSPRIWRRSSSGMAAKTGWTNWRITWNGTCRSCSPPLAQSTVQPRSRASRRRRLSSVVLPTPAGPANPITPPWRAVSPPSGEVPHRPSSDRSIASSSDSRSSSGAVSRPRCSPAVVMTCPLQRVRPSLGA
ncbi:hypothetical protein SUDANB99_05548 [Streptomyces sp. enrichment culture]